MKKYLITFGIILLVGLLLGASGYYPSISNALLSFNSGELSPLVELRSDYTKYNNSCKTLENMLVLMQGPIIRRPGTEYIARVGDANYPVRLIPFEYSKTDTYILEFGNSYIRFYRNGGQILDSNSDPYEISTDYDYSELFDIQYAQYANAMYLVDGNDPPQKLTRASHTSWAIADVNFTTGPFQKENTADINVTPSATTGTITITADSDIFQETHIGSLWKIGHRKQATTLNGILDANESSDTLACSGDYDLNVEGTWEGTAYLERSTDSGSTWEAVYTRYNSGAAVNEDFSDSEDEDGVIYRVTMDGFVSGTATYNFSVHNYIAYGIVKIASYVDANEVTATVLTDLADTNNTKKWSEGYWSDYRGWPQSIEFHEQRLVFGGSESYPQTIWASKTASGESDDYEDMTEGVDDDDAIIYILPSQNPIQWMLSQTYLLIGTLDSVGRWGSSDDDSPITPTNPTNYRMQAKTGSAKYQAIFAGSSILYIERGGQRVREFTYSLEQDRFVSPDLTILAEHITSPVISNIAYQTRPNSVLWCVLEDGDIACLTYERTQDVIGWSKIITDGDFESVAVIPSASGGQEDEVWVSVERNVDGTDYRYIEQFQSIDWGDDQNDCYFVDSGLRWDGGDSVSITHITQANPAVVTVSTWPSDGDGTALADGDQIEIADVEGMTEVNGNVYTIDDADSDGLTFTLDNSLGSGNVNSTGFSAYASGGTVRRVERDFSSLDHLEGKAVSILGDGNHLEDETVSSGAIQTDEWVNKICVGLPFTSKFETMPFVLGMQEGSSAGKESRISLALVNFYKTLGVKYGTSSEYLQDVSFVSSLSDNAEDYPSFYTGWKSLINLGGYKRDITLHLQQDKPLPFGLRGINVKLDVSEK